MTDTELKELVASLAEDRKETDRIIKETDRIVKETSLQMKETAKQMKETDRKLKELGINLGGINENIGHHAEQFFQNVFEKKLEFGGVKFDEMIPNLSYKGKIVKIEFDIALVNGVSIALIEVKNRIHPNFVKKFAEERLPIFRKYFQEFDKCKAYLGIAAFSFGKDVLKEAKKYGIGIVRQAGDSVEIDSRELRAY